MQLESSPPTRIQPGKGVGGQVLVTGRPFRTDNYAPDPGIGKDSPAEGQAGGLIAELGVPISIGDRVEGILFVGNRSPRAFTGRDEETLLRLADQAAIAIANARLFSQEQARRRQLEAMRAISEEITRELDFHSVLDLIVQRAVDLIGVRAGAVWLWDEAAQVLTPQVWIGYGPWLAGLRLRLGEGVAGRVAERRDGTIINDFRGSPLALPAVLEHSAVRAVVAEPLLYGDRLLGVLNLAEEETGRNFGEEDRQILRLFAAQAAIALQNAQLHEATGRRAEQLATLNRLAVTLTGALEPHEVAEQVLGAVQVLLAGAAVRLWTWHRDDESLRLVQGVGFRDSAGGLRQRFRLGEGLVGAAAASRQPTICSDVTRDPRFEDHEWAAAEGLAALIVVPLVYGERLSGVLSVFTRTPHEFSQEEIELLSAFAAQAAIALENARLYASSEQRAMELEALREIDQAITARLQLSAAMEAVVGGALQLLRTEHAQITLWDEAAQRLKFGAAVGEEAERVRVQQFELGRGINGVVAQTRRAVIVNDYATSPYVLPEFSDIVATITVPVLFGDRLLGILHSHTTRPGMGFTSADLRRLEMLAGRAAIALENARLYEAAERRAEQLATLNRLTGLLTTVMEPQQVATQILTAMQVLFQGGAVRLWRWKKPGESLELVGGVGFRISVGDVTREVRLGEGILGSVAATRQPAWSRDVTRDPGFVDPAWAAREGLVSLLAVPLVSGDRAHGVLSVFTREPHEFTAEELNLLSAFAAQAAIALENARLFQEKEDLAQAYLLRLGQISILNEIAEAVQGMVQLNAIFQVILTGVTYGEGLGFNRAILFLVNESAGLLEGRMGVGPSSGEEAAQVWQALGSKGPSLRDLIAERTSVRPPGELSPFDRLARSLRIPLRADQGLLARTALEGRPFHVRGAPGDPAVHPQWEGRLEVKEFASVPLMAKGKVIGVLAVDNRYSRKPITSDDVEFLWAFANQAGLAVERARMYNHLEEANREIQRSHHRLLQQERLATLGEMAAHVVHEIRNPLVAVGGFAQRLAQHLGSREPEGRYAGIIAREVDRLERILQNVRAISRDTSLGLSEVDLHDLLQECLVLFAEQISAQRVVLQIDFTEGPPLLQLDPVQIKQAVLNLVSNALEAMPEGGVLTVGSRVIPCPERPADAQEGAAAGSRDGAPAEEWVVFSIADTGSGIPAENVDRIFDPFFTTKETGTGLGLPLVRWIVRAHGGRLEVNNRPGEGVTFEVWLPLKVPTPPR